jgi:hypothetical protein
VDGKWSTAEHQGFLRLHALPAKDLWTAHNTLTQRAVGPRSLPTVVMETDGMRPGDVAGLALFNRPYSWLGVERNAQGLTVAQFDEQSGQTVRAPLTTSRVWLRADCNFLDNTSQFSYSVDGREFYNIGERLTMPYGLITFQGVRAALFSYNKSGVEGGFADFDSFTMNETAPRGLTKPIPYGRRIVLTAHGSAPQLQLGISGTSLVAGANPGIAFSIVNRGLGRVALRYNKAFVSVDSRGATLLRNRRAGKVETFQWIETLTGEITLMSLTTSRYLRVDFETGKLLVDSPGPRPDGNDGVRFDWREKGTV